MSEETHGFEGWAILELFGHRRLAGYVRPEEQYGQAMLRIDVHPGEATEAVATQWYGGASIYCLTPTTEAIARAVAKGNRPAPVQRWELPAPEPRKECMTHPGSGHIADSPACDRMCEMEANEVDDDADYVDDHCPECGEYESECGCEEAEEVP